MDKHPSIDDTLPIRFGFPTPPEIPLSAIIPAPPFFLYPILYYSQPTLEPLSYRSKL
jgi:hypothetical protein